MRNGWKVKSPQRFSDCLVSRDSGVEEVGAQREADFILLFLQTTREPEALKKKEKGTCF